MHDGGRSDFGIGCGRRKSDFDRVLDASSTRRDELARYWNLRAVAWPLFTLRKYRSTIVAPGHGEARAAMVRIRLFNGAKDLPADIAARQPPTPDSARDIPGVPRSHRQTDDVLSLLHNFEQTNQGWFWATNSAGRLTYLTESLSATLDVAPTAVIGSAFTDHFVRCDDGAEISRTLPFMMARRSSFEKLMLRTAKRGDDRWWLVSGSAQFDGAGHFLGYRGSGVDITEQRRSSEQASQLAMYDALTGLPNRLHMSRTLETSLIALRHQKRPCAILLIDLDRFKQVNDTLGHPAGDALLKQVGERLFMIVGDKEKIFRLGGDEFQIILSGNDDRGVLGDLANRIIASLSQPYSVAGSRCIIGASIGIAVAPSDGSASEELIRNVDLALYAAKAGGRGRFRFFSSDLLAAATDRRLLEEDLRDALAKGEIDLLYQPIVNARTNCVTGVEALIRWTHPQRGPISPALFIPIAEEANLIQQIGEWVIRRACDDAVRWPGALRVAVNVSPTQFTNEALPKIVMSALAASGLPPARLELELTEGVFLSESPETDSMFAMLKDIGVRLALDDFGTGYSSLGYLKTAPFDKIKVDQSFVREVATPGSRNRAIIAAIVALAEALDMETTAEGIESFDQLTLVRDLRVSHVQGYIYSKAVGRDEIARKLENGDWSIAPVGPARQRSDRQSMYRKAGAILGNFYHAVTVRNLSETGALIDGLIEVAPGTPMILDFGDGQLVGATVRRVSKRQTGVEFGLPLVNDGNGGLCTRQRVAPYLLAASGLGAAGAAGSAAIGDEAASPTIEQLADRLGISLSPASAATSMVSYGPGATADPGGAEHSAIPTIEQFAQRYLDHLGNRGRTRQIHDDCLRKHILPQFGRFRLDEMAYSDLNGWLNATAMREGQDTAVANRLRGVMGYMFVLAQRWGVPGADVNPLARQTLETGGRDRRLAPDDIERLCQAAQASQNPHLGAIVSLLLTTRLRVREILGARWEDVDLDGRQWKVAGENGETDTVSLSSAAIGVIRQLPRWEDCPHVIANPRTKRPYRSIFRSWDAARRRAGVPDISMHELRRFAK
jgi:diguanylate cyclase (GGDEF)-like protein